MQNILKNTTGGEAPGAPWILLLILSGYILAALFLFTFLAQFLVLILFGFDLTQMVTLLSNPYGSGAVKMPLMIIQGVTSLGAFIIAPLVFLRFNLKASIGSFFTLPSTPLRPLFMTLVILICFMVADSIVIEWNQNLKMPEFMRWFEIWAQSKEAQLEELTEYLTSFSNIYEYIIGLLVIAVIPAIGEELLFRGLIQNLFSKALKNPHLAIWVSAILFGVFHMQFYGVIPRILLGALFGYLYYWSGHLSLAMFGHFLNNGLTLTMLYFSQLHLTDFDPTSTESSPPLYAIILFFVAGAALLYLFKNYFLHTEDGQMEESV